MAANIDSESPFNSNSRLGSIAEQAKIRESEKVNIIPYENIYKKAFKDLNERWITQYFKMEAYDYKALDNPEEYIVLKGGLIMVALYNGVPSGVCALIKMDDSEYDFELAKMAVSPNAQGKNIGWLLATTIINKARDLGARKIYLESNTLLKPAISLYEKIGFQKVADRPTPYQRSNIQMALSI